MGFTQKSDGGATSASCSDPTCPGPGDDDNGNGNGGGGSTNPTTKSFDVTIDPKLNKVDILLVIDNSKSMTQERSELANRLEGFVAQLDSEGIDWQMCYMTTHYYQNSSASVAMSWVGYGQKVLNNSVSNKATIFRDSINGVPLGQSGDGSRSEVGIAVTYDAISKSQNQNCFRNDAALATILISDEDEDSCGGRCGSSLMSISQPDNLIQHVKSTFSNSKPFTFHSIVIKPNDPICFNIQGGQGWPAFYGEVYADLSTKTGGIVGDVCASDYTNQLQNIGNRISNTLGSLTLDCAPVSGSLNLIIQGSTGSTYQLAGNKIIFTPALTEGTRVYGTYQCSN